MRYKLAQASVFFFRKKRNFPTCNKLAQVSFFFEGKLIQTSCKKSVAFAYLRPNPSLAYRTVFLGDNKMDVSQLSEKQKAVLNQVRFFVPSIRVSLCQFMCYRTM